MTRGARGARRTVLIGMMGLALAPAAAVRAQSLETADSLIARGRIADARQAAQGWWDARWDEASRHDRQRGLWLRGRLTVDPAQARRDYQRLALEYPGGAFTDGALLRLGQLADARGRPVEAADHFQELVRGYPDSPRRLEARRWLDEHGSDVARTRRRREAEEPGPRTEVREAPREEPEEESAEVEPEEEVAAGSEAESAGPVAVQLGAFSALDRARSHARALRASGVEVRLVRVEGSDLIRVRTGRFPSRTAARDLRTRLRGMNLDVVIVTDANRETPIR